MHNQHVYLYYRWQAWLAKEQKKWLAYEFARQWAENERNGWPYA